jgi:Domain of unknown function (DUF4442)
MKSLTTFSMTANNLRRILNWWPPMMGAGIRVVEFREDFTYAKVQMPLTWYNRNYVGTHYGGSLYSMCDPFYMLLLINALGRDFVVWDKAGSIEYVKPGIGRVTAEFHLSNELLDSLRAMAPDEKRLVDLNVDVKDDDGDTVARLVKTEYIRRKGDKGAKNSPRSSADGASTLPGSPLSDTHANIPKSKL